MQLVVDNLTLERGGRTLLAELSFKVASGEALLLTGPNGAGKTTLLRAIAGLLAKTSGVIRLDGGKNDSEPSEQCHYVGHANGITAHLTVRENLNFWAQYLGEGADAVTGTAQALDALELAPLADIPAGYLSAGQMRRCGLARLVLAKRPLWLLDEPTVSLDASAAALLTGLISRHCAAGGLALIATHLPLGLASPRFVNLGQRAGVPA